MSKKEKLDKIRKDYDNYCRSLGVNIDSDYNSFDGYDMPNYKCRPSIPTSDRIVGDTKKRVYSTQIPTGKTISVAYNKGPYMIVDAVDFKTMGKRYSMRTMMLITILVLMTTMMAKANPVTTWVENEKNKIVEYQKSSWEKGKEQNAANWEKIKSLFTKVKNNVTQD